MIVKDINKKNLTVIEAIKDKLYPDAYSYDGEVNKLKCQVALQSDMMAELIDRLVRKGLIDKHGLDAILGHYFDVVEDS